MEGYNLNEPEFEEGSNALNKSLELMLGYSDDVEDSAATSLANSLGEDFASMQSQIVDNSKYVYSKVLTMNKNTEDCMLYLAHIFPDNPYFSAKLASNRINEFTRAYEMFQDGDLDSEQFSLLVKSFYADLIALGYLENEINTMGVTLDMNFNYDEWLDNGMTEGEQLAITLLYNCYNNIYYNGIYRYLVEDEDAESHSTMFGIERDELINFAEENLIEMYGVESFKNWRGTMGRDLEAVLARELAKRDVEALDYLHSVHGEFSDEFWEFLTSGDSSVMSEEEYLSYFNSLSDEQKEMFNKAISYYSYLEKYRYVDSDIMDELDDWIYNDTAIYSTDLGIPSGKLGDYHYDYQYGLTNAGGEYDGNLDFLYQIPASILTGYVSGIASVVEDLIDGTVMITTGTLNACTKDCEVLVSLFSPDTANKIKDYRTQITDSISDFIGTDYCEKGYYSVESYMGVPDKMASELYGPSSGIGAATGNMLLGLATGNIGSGTTTIMVTAGTKAVKAVGSAAEKSINEGASFDHAYNYSMVTGAATFASSILSSDTVGLGIDQYSDKIWYPLLDAGIEAAESFESYASEYYCYAKYLTNDDGTNVYGSFGDYMDGKWGGLAKDAAVTTAKGYGKMLIE